MNRREFLRSAALAAASLIAPKSSPKVEELEARLEEQDGLLDLWIKHHQNVLDLWEQRCAELEKEAAFYHSLCNSGADRVRSLMEENVQLDRENHDLAFQLWVWSMACGTGEEQQAQRTAELLERRLQREAAGWGADDNALPMREWGPEVPTVFYYRDGCLVKREGKIEVLDQNLQPFGYWKIDGAAEFVVYHKGENNDQEADSV